MANAAVSKDGYEEKYATHPYHQLVERFGAAVLAEMTEKPLPSVVTQAIQELTETVAEETNDKAQQVPQPLLHLTAHCIGILESAVERHERDQDSDHSSHALRDALVSDLNHRHAARQDVLYGVPLSKNTPYLWDVIPVYHNGVIPHMPSREIPQLLVANDAYIDKAIADATEALFETKKHRSNDPRYRLDFDRSLMLRREDSDERGKDEDDAEDEDMDDGADSQSLVVEGDTDEQRRRRHTVKDKFHIIDQDLDDWGVREHQVQLRLAPREVAMKPSALTAEANRQHWKLMAHYTPATQLYPLIFPQHDWAEFMRTSAKQRKELCATYSCQTTVDLQNKELQRKRRLAAFLSKLEGPQKESPAQRLKRRRNSAQLSEQGRPLDVVAIACDVPGAAGEVDEDRPMHLNPMAGARKFNRYLKCWPLRKIGARQWDSQSSNSGRSGGSRSLERVEEGQDGEEGDEAEGEERREEEEEEGRGAMILQDEEEEREEEEEVANVRGRAEEEDEEELPEYDDDEGS